ncbi:MAG: hypothetical protein ACK4L7_04725 [Flavobacteriales bacterium]
MRTLACLLFVALAAGALAASPTAPFVENKRQWPDQVLFRALVPGGALFVERSALTFVQFSDSPLRHHGHAHAGPIGDHGKAHAYRVHFEGGAAQAWEGGSRQPYYENHFIGSDPARWGAGCAVYGEVLLKGVWPGIDLRSMSKAAP